MRSWRNWQTRKTKDLVGNSMQVQFLSTAPKSGNYAKIMHKCPIFFAFLNKYSVKKAHFSRKSGGLEPVLVPVSLKNIAT